MAEYSKITVDDIFGEGFQQKMNQIATDAGNLKAAIVGMAKEIKGSISSGGNSEIKDLTGAVNALSEAYKNCGKFIKEHEEVQRGASNTAKNYNALTKQEVEELEKFKNAIETTVIDEKKFEDALKSSGDSVNLLKQKIKMLEDVVKTYSQVEQENVRVVQVHSAGLAQLKVQLDATSKALSVKMAAAKASASAVKELTEKEQQFLELQKRLANEVSKNGAAGMNAARSAVGDTSNYSLKEQIELLKTLDQTTAQLSKTDRERLATDQNYINLRNSLDAAIKTSKSQLAAQIDELTERERRFLELKERISSELASGGGARISTVTQAVGDVNNYSLNEQIELLRTLDKATADFNQQERARLSTDEAYLNLRNGLNAAIRTSKEELAILNEVRERANSTTGNTIQIEQRLLDIKIRSKLFDEQKVADLNRIVSALHAQSIAQTADAQAIIQTVDAINLEQMSYNELSALYSALKEVMNSVSLEQQEQNDGWAAMKNKLADMYDTMNKYQQATGRFQMNVGKYRSAFDGLSYSIQQVVREAPNLAISANTFFLAISNNLPMVAEQISNFKQQQEEIKENLEKLEEAGRTATEEYQKLSGQVQSLGKKILSSIFNWQTAIVTLSFVLTKWGAQIVKWFKELITGVKSVNNEISRATATVTMMKDVLSSVLNTQTELRAITHRLKQVTQGSDEWRVGVKRVNELTHSNLDATTATIKSVEDVTKAYTKQAIQLAQNESIIKQISESMDAKARYDMFSRGIKKGNVYIRNMETLATSLGIKRFDDKGEVTKEYEELEKLYGNYMSAKKRREFATNALAGLSPEQARENVYGSSNVTGAAAGYKSREQSYKEMIAEADKTMVKLDNYAKTRLNWMSDETTEWLLDQIRLVEDIDKKKDKKKSPSLKDVDLMYQEAMEARANLAGEVYEKLLKVQDEKLQVEADNLRKKLEEENADIAENLKNGLVTQKEANEQKLKLEENYQTARASIVYKHNLAIEQLDKKHYERINKEFRKSLNDEVNKISLTAKTDAKKEMNGIQPTSATIEDEAKKNEALRRQIAIYTTAADEIRDRLQRVNSELQAQADEAVKPLIEELKELSEQYEKINSGDFNGSPADKNNALTDLQTRISKIKSEIEVVKNNIIDSENEAAEQGKKRIDELTQQANDALKKIDYSQRLNPENYSKKAMLKNRASKYKYGLMSTLFSESEIDEMKENGTFEELWSKAFENTLTAVNVWKDSMVSSINEVIESYVRLMEAKVEAAKENTEAAKEEYEKEKSYMDAGYANSIETAWAEYQEKKELQAKAQLDYANAQKAQEAVDAAAQVSSLTTATANIWAASTKAGGLLSPAIASALTATMWAAFIGAKAYAASITSRTAQYGDGHVEMIGGGSHASGHDSPLAYDAKGRERRVEGGEMFAVFSRKAVSRYGQGNITDLVNSYNNGTFDKSSLSSVPAAAFFNEKAAPINLANIEGSLDEITRSHSKNVYYPQSNMRIVEGRNSRVVYIKR